MKKKIIVINGGAGIGKDAFVKNFSKYRKTKNFDSVGKIKELARSFGWDGLKDEKGRKLLSDLKIVTTAYNDFSYGEVCKAIAEFESSDEEVMFIHIREPQEIDRVVKNFGAKSLILRNSDVKRVTTNSADANVENYKYDYEISDLTFKNNEKKAKDFANMIDGN